MVSTRKNTNLKTRLAWVVAITLCAVAIPAAAFAATPSAPLLLNVWVNDVNQIGVSWAGSTDASIPSIPGHTVVYDVYRSTVPIDDTDLPATPVASGLTVGSVIITADNAEIAQSYVWFYAVQARDSDGLLSPVSNTG